ncbi:MAG: hypothetical protein GC162_17970 [Planctomycetes bacterium]|nr:hypothetical protein [Planctomycetota bacterium]
MRRIDRPYLDEVAMRKPNIFGGMVVVSCCALAQGAISYEDVTRVDQGAVAYYNFNETSGTSAADAVGSNNATHGSGVTVNQSAAPRPLDFGGFGSGNVSALYNAGSSTSSTTIPTAVGMNTTAGSVSMWIRTTPGQADSDNGGLFYGRGGGSTGGDGFGGENELHLQLNTNGSLGFFATGNSSNFNNGSDAGVRDGQWHLVGATWAAGGQVKLYVDGQQIASNADTGSSTYNLDNNIQLGRLGTSGNFNNRQFGGNMDEVALFDTELNAMQMRDQYNAAVNHYTGADFVYQPDANGAIVGEAEIFSTRTNSGANGWVIVPTESSGAGPAATNVRNSAYIQSLPDNGSPGTPNGAPSIQYKMQINTPGTYQLYLRWDGNNTDSGTQGASDSVFVGIEELTGAGTDWYELNHGIDADFNTTAWDGTGQAEVNTASPAHNPVTFTVGAAGVYTLKISQREDGSTVDAFVLQPVASAAPTGIGPNMSTFGLEVEAENYTRRGASVLGGVQWKVIDGAAGTGNVGNGEDQGEPSGAKFANAQGDLYMQTVPGNSGETFFTAQGVLDGPFLDYEVTVPVTGVYQLFARADGYDGGSDSLYARVLEINDGTGGQADWYRYSFPADSDFDTTPWLGTAGFEKTDSGGGDVNAVWRLIGGQTYTIRFSPREDGVALDAFRLTLLVPEPASMVMMLGLSMLGVISRPRHRD